MTLATRRQLVHALAAACLLALAPTLAAADPTNVDQTLFPTKDTYIQSTNENNKGAQKAMRIGYFPEETTEYRTYLHFDTATLKKQPVRSAILRLHSIDGHHGAQPLFIRIHPLYREWTEDGLTPVMATKEEGWLAPHGDFLPKPCGGGAVPKNYSGTALDTWYSFDVTQVVQQWQNGTLKNYGLMLMIEKGSDIWITYESRESANRPQLLVSYNQAISVSDGTILSGTGITDFGPQPIFHPVVQDTEIYKGVAGEPYKKQLRIKGGEKPYKCEFVGLKPESFDISESGLITGNPTKPISTSLRIKVTGADKKSATVSLKLVIDKAPEGVVQNPAAAKPNDPAKPPADPAKPADPTKPAADLPQDDG